MSEGTNNSMDRRTEECCDNQESLKKARDNSMPENGTYANDQDVNMAEEPSTNAQPAGETMDDTSSSTSEEVMSGTQSDQTANISSNGGYSGDYESISDSSSGASKKRKSRTLTAKAGSGVSGRRRRDEEEMKEEKAADAMEDGDTALSQNRPSSLAHMNAAEGDDGNNMSVVDHRRHHHHHQGDGKHHASSNNTSGHHHHHYHHTNRPNKSNSKQVNRQIDEIMNLYNVSLQAQANAQAAMRGDATNTGKMEADTANENDTSMAGDSNMNEMRKQNNLRVHYPYQVESMGSLTEDHKHPPRRSSIGSMSSNNKNSTFNDLGGPVQLGGVRITDPSDPRVDVARLYHQDQSGRPKDDSTRVEGSHTNNDNDNNAHDSSSHNMDECYNNLLEACRPFFQDSQTIMKSRKVPMFQTAAHQSQAGSDEAQSSSGFTSFFTTTKSESNTNGSGGSSQSEFSQQNKKRKSEEKQEQDESKDSTSLPDNVSRPNHDRSENTLHHHHQRQQNQQHYHQGGASISRTRSHSGSHPEAYQSDSSSMVVLARVKRKHKEQQRRHVGNGSSNSDNTAKAVCAVSSSASGQAAASSQGKREGEVEENVSKRVRIETVALDAAKYRSSTKPLLQPNNKQPESSSLSSGLSMSVDSSGSDGGGGEVGGVQTERHEGAHNGTTTTSVEDRSKTDSQSGSAEISNNQAARTVTDTSGTTTANNSSGSGTGSGNDNDATNKSESGSQMEGNSNSDDKAGVYCEKDSMSDTNTNTSVAAVNGDGKKKAELLQQSEKPMIHHHNHSGKKVPVVDNLPPEEPEPMTEEPETPINDSNLISKEEKLIEKKRKRMSARKEYEEEWQRQMRDSSESSARNDTSTLEPGKPVTLEEVLSFTKTARLLVQALPPFLAVHANAAFTQLTGIDSHTVIGQPVASIIAIAEGVPPNKESDSSGSDMTNNKDAMSSLSGSLEGNEGQNEVGIANANDANGQNQEQPPNDDNMAVNVQEPVLAGLRIDRLIVARGYGHIHNVEVLYVPPHTPTHAIEGSEVKIGDGSSNAKRRKKDDKIFCRMSVSPVVTSIESWDRGREGHTDSKVHPSSGGNKRRKHGHGTNEFMTVKHYLIQLESIDGPRLLAKRSSFSSSTDTTVEAQLLGITRSELVARRCRLESNQRSAPEAAQAEALPSVDERNGGYFPETDSQDENVSVVEPVATCG